MFQTRRGFVLFGLSGLGGSAWAYDTFFCYERFNRNARSVFAAALTLYDYKFAIDNCLDENDLNKLHDKVAKRWYNVCCKNGGLYIKIGQSVNTFSCPLFHSPRKAFVL